MEAESAQLFSKAILLWLKEHDPQYFYSHPLQHTQQLINDTIDLIAGVLNYFSCPVKLLTVVMKYANVFVDCTGIQQATLLHLLLISTIVTIKMWGTENMAVNQIIADLFQLATSDINNMEFEFLKALDYDLFLNVSELENYCASIEAALACAYEPRGENCRTVLGKRKACSKAQGQKSPRTRYYHSEIVV